MHFLILGSIITRCISISTFASFLGIFIGITSSVIGLKTGVKTGGIKKYQTMIKKKKDKPDKTILLAK